MRGKRHEKARRGSFIALATGIFLVVSFNSTPSAPSVPQGPPPPDPEEIAALEEIADWLIGGETKFHVLELSDLRQGASRRQTFELFRHYTDPASREDLLVSFPYGEAIHQAAERHRLDGLLLAALVEVESSFRPGVVSPDGAVGLAQVLPSTGRLYGASNLDDPEVNLDVGARYLRSLLDRFGGSLELALAAYNAGPTRVSRYGGVPPFTETREYVDRVLSTYVDHHRTVWDTTGATEALLFR